ncbi:MAG: CopG family antitoxin [Lautropia sp.]|nr:CopG family antitoxin [Lautropia sp.]
MSGGKVTDGRALASLCSSSDLMEDIKAAANVRDMPYQSLIKAWLYEKVGS